MRLLRPRRSGEILRAETGMSATSRPRSVSSATGGRGQAFIALLVILGVVVGTLVFATVIRPSKQTIEKEKITAAALAQAKAALIGFAAGIDVTAAASRPGDLPCPDSDNDGTADTPCSGGALGRLPWNRLGLPDLRDGDGERLWYAVSSNFKNNPRTSCASAGDAGCLNSDARGTITVRNRDGTVINDGSNPSAYMPSGVIAVIIAPGRVLQRQGATTPQDRNCTVGVDCDAAERCTTSPPTLTAKCNPINYLDLISGTEDNADFVDGNATNGFIQGDVFDASGGLIINDRIITITYADLMPLLERRVAKEVLNCLNAYAALPANRGRYPWAARAADWPSFADRVDIRFGRVPDTLNDTRLGLAGGVADTICPPLATCMEGSWPASCTITSGSWWNNWKEIVFYGVADPYKPADPLTGITGVFSGGPCSNDCLEVAPPSSTNDKRVVVIVAGTRLSAVSGGQPRSALGDKRDSSRYLEDENDGGTTQSQFTQKSTTSTFNDVLVYQQ